MSLVAFDVRPEGRDTLAAPTGRGAPADRVLSSRVRVLTEIAERYAELVDPLGGPAGVRGDGEALGLMPRTYTPTVREFERLVSRLRDADRSLWWHLDGWWLSASRRTMFHCPRCGMTHQPRHVHPSRRNSGKPVSVECKRVIVWTRRRGITESDGSVTNPRESEAKAAVEWIALAWSLPSEPMLPDEIRAVA